MNKRVMYDIAVFMAIVYLPFWLVIVLCIFGMYAFVKWYEVIAFIAIFEFLFRAPSPEFVSMSHAMIPLTFYAIIIFIVAEWLRKRIRK